LPGLGSMPPDQDPPARRGPDPAVTEPGHGPPGVDQAEHGPHDPPVSSQRSISRYSGCPRPDPCRLLADRGTFCRDAGRPGLSGTSEAGIHLGKRTSACPLSRARCTTGPIKLPVRKSKATTWSSPAQYRRPPGPNRNPRGLRNPTDGSGAKTRTSCPVAGSFPRTLGTASAAPNGHSLATTMFPLGASFRSSGLSLGSVTRRGVQRARAIEDHDGVIAFSGRPDA